MAPRARKWAVVEALRFFGENQVNYSELVAILLHRHSAACSVCLIWPWSLVLRRLSFPAGFSCWVACRVCPSHTVMADPCPRARVRLRRVGSPAAPTRDDPVAQGLERLALVLETRVRFQLRSVGLCLAVLLLLFASARYGEPPTPAAAAVCRTVRIRWFHARVRYYANTDASFNPSRLILLSGDVETNPGPTRASESRNGGPQLNIYYQNVRSLKNKLSVLRSEAPVLRKFDVISLTETWLNSDVETTELQLSLSDYTVFRRDRCGRVGGGVMVAVKTELMPRRRDDLETDCECLVVQIVVMRGRSCLVATVYRPPDDPAALTEFYKCAQSAISTGSPTIFCGDFNLRYLRWSAVAETGITRHSFTRNCDRRQSLEFVDNLELYGFKQLVFEPTGESGTFLDLVLTDIPGSAALCDSVFSSDHHALRVEMCVCITRRPLPTRSRAFNYKRAD